MRYIVTDLTIAYNHLPTFPDEWYQEFLACFDADRSEDVIILKHMGIAGDLAKARFDLINACKTEFISIVDPDDLFDINVIIKAKNLLKRNKRLGIVGFSENTIIENVIKPAEPYAPFSFDRMYKDPRELHNGAVMRVDYIKNIIFMDLLKIHTNVDHIIRLMMVSTHGVVKLKDLGYTWRKHITGQHMKDEPTTWVYRRLIEIGVIKYKGSNDIVRNSLNKVLNV